MAVAVLQEVSADETLRAELRFQEKAARDRVAELAYEGISEGVMKVAKNLLAMGCEDSMVVQATGLTLEAVRGLRAQR